MKNDAAYAWAAARILSAANGILIAVLIGVLWLIESPRSYPPADQTLEAGLVVAMSLVVAPLVFGERNRHRVARVVRGAFSRAIFEGHRGKAASVHGAAAPMAAVHIA